MKPMSTHDDVIECDVPMDKPVKTYRVYYRMECFVEAQDEDEAMQKYGDGEGEDAEYVEFMSIEQVAR